MKDMNRVLKFQTILKYIETQEVRNGKYDYSQRISSLVLQLLELYIPSARDFLNINIDTPSELMLGKSINKIRRRWFINKYDYRLLVKYQFEVLCDAFGLNIEELDYQKFFKINGVKELSLNRIPEYKKFIIFIDEVNKLFHKPQKNIVICGTMSAGKSTFLNALIGNKLLPARNEPTTAKITSIFANSLIDDFCGYYELNKDVKVLSKAESKDIDVISDNIEVDRIILQGNIKGIKGSQGTILIYDTPGTNNSCNDDEHFRITSSFINKTKVDVLIYVANICYLETLDERRLLDVVKKKCMEENIIPVFILNKADRVESQEESISDIYDSYKCYLQELGFKSPELFVVSSKTALLIKMILNDKVENFTESEIDDFEGLFNKFLKRLNLSRENIDINCDDDANYIFDGQNYKKHDLLKVYMTSGLYEIEKKMEASINEGVI